jgi:hypothetical protein
MSCPNKKFVSRFFRVFFSRFFLCSRHFLNIFIEVVRRPFTNKVNQVLQRCKSQKRHRREEREGVFIRIGYTICAMHEENN